MGWAGADDALSLRPALALRRSVSKRTPDVKPVSIGGKGEGHHVLSPQELPKSAGILAGK